MLLNYILYLQESEIFRLPKDKALYGAEIAMGLGKAAMVLIGEKTENLSALLEYLGIEKICSIQSDIFESPVRAYYTPHDKSININRDSINTTYNILRIYNLPYFSESIIYKMYVLHEVFHHIETYLTGYADDVIKSKLRVQSNLSIFRDISAFSFVNSILSGFPCQITDLLWRCYFNKGQEELLYKLVKENVLSGDQ